MKCTFPKIEINKLNLFAETTVINMMSLERKRYI